MDAETSLFESSEMLATFISSTPVLQDSWRLCSLANTSASVVTDQVRGIAYVAFSGTIMPPLADPSCANLEALDRPPDGLFPPLQQRHAQHQHEDPPMLHAAILHHFLSLYTSPAFLNQILTVIEKSKAVVMTGHSMGGAVASLSALWLLSHLQSTSSSLPVLCITFGSPLLGNEALSRAILRERWAGNFCHVVSNHDFVPRLFLAPLPSLSTQQPHFVRQFWHLLMTSLQSVSETIQLFRSVLPFVQASAATTGEGRVKSPFSPFGNYLFFSEEGAVCVNDAAAAVKMLELMFTTASPGSSIEDHLKYGDYVGKASWQLLMRKSFTQGEPPESSYEAGVALAVQSCGLARQESIAGPAKDCLKMAKRVNPLPPHLNSANLAITLSKNVPYRAQIEWFKASCDKSDDQMGYYDSFKLRGASKKGAKINMNRCLLAGFWDNVIYMLESNQLPHDFNKRAKWVNASQFYKLLVEPLDIAEYYRTGKHRTQGHYLKNGREKRYEIFDRWWKGREVGDEENNKRTSYASLTQDSCFWARVEEAKDWLDQVRSESDTGRSDMLWQDIDRFESYATRLVENKEVSIDVLAKNSSFTLLMEELQDFKKKTQQFPPQFPAFWNEEMVP
ncbi:hypothetical protein AAG906_024202 [Vitis piasezkii]